MEGGGKLMQGCGPSKSDFGSSREIKEKLQISWPGGKGPLKGIFPILNFIPLGGP